MSEVIYKAKEKRFAVSFAVDVKSGTKEVYFGTDHIGRITAEDDEGMPLDITLTEVVDTMFVEEVDDV